MESELMDAFIDQRFGVDQGLKFAAALTTYNRVEDDEQDETIATLNARQISWGFEGSSYDDKISLEYCSQKELGFEEVDGEVRRRELDPKEKSFDVKDFYPIS